MVFAGWSDAKCSLAPATQRPAGFEPDELQPLIHHYTKQPNVRGQHGEAAQTGNGKILGVFRGIPGPARELVDEKIALLKEAGIDGVYTVGNTSEPLCQIPVGLNRFGMIQLSGLNPVAAAVEVGIEVDSIAESGLIDFEQLMPVWQLPDK